MSTEVCHSRDLHHGDASVLPNNTVLPVEHNHGAQHPDQSDKQPPCFEPNVACFFGSW